MRGVQYIPMKFSHHFLTLFCIWVSEVCRYHNSLCNSKESEMGYISNEVYTLQMNQHNIRREQGVSCRRFGSHPIPLPAPITTQLIMKRPTPCILCPIHRVSHIEGENWTIHFDPTTLSTLNFTDFQYPGQHAQWASGWWVNLHYVHVRMY